MLKHTQAIRWLLPKNCVNVFDHFVGLALKGLIRTIVYDDVADFEIFGFTKKQDSKYVESETDFL